ncbi:hypothetical protein LJR289_001763 [Pseudoduganella sp. LjRoot289]|uniref:hypothetical protein n=1 Tax=Pseudoduganella sp. LjRoot289 TaxID=3342314 RepID=UPI003ECDB551
MATNDQRHSLIQRRVMHRPGAVAEDSVLLWKRLAVELSSLVGEAAFQTLFARSVHLARVTYPWLTDGADPGFDRLRAALEQQDAGLAGAASIALFTTFTDTLILLIGESLTTTILYTSWGQDAADTAAKEPNHE